LPKAECLLVECLDGEHDFGKPYHLLDMVIWVFPQGNHPTFLTSHDVGGPNHKLCSNTFFNFEVKQEITKHFVVCHLVSRWCATWSAGGGSRFPQGYQFPSMKQLAAMLPRGVQYMIEFRVGSRAYVLAKFAPIFPKLVEELVLMSPNPSRKGWIDCMATKLSGLTGTLPDTVLSHFFCQELLVNNTELVQTLLEHGDLEHVQQLFWNMYNSCRDLDINLTGAVPNARPSAW
uniref:Uncharacterized protein n=1 Tax=Ailuropoda melanoleuca TaxID=9646 RepID=G1L3U1_AILME